MIALTAAVVRNTVKEIMGTSDITPQDLLDETVVPRLIEEHRKAYLKKYRANGLKKLLHCCKSSIFQDFECFHRTEVDLVEDDIRLLLQKMIQILSLMKHIKVSRL